MLWMRRSWGASCVQWFSGRPHAEIHSVSPYSIFYFYLILFPQHWKLVVIDGWFYHLHVQVINAEIEIPKPEHNTVKKMSDFMNSWIQTSVSAVALLQFWLQKYSDTICDTISLSCKAARLVIDISACKGSIRFFQCLSDRYKELYVCLYLRVCACDCVLTYSWSRTPVAAWPSNCCCCRMLSKSSMRWSEFSIWAGRWQLRKQMVWPNTDMRALTPPLFPCKTDKQRGS